MLWGAARNSGNVVQPGAWQAEQRLTSEALGRRLGLGCETARMQAGGRQVPRREAMARWVEVSGGRVSPLDFYPLSPAQLVRILDHQLDQLDPDEVEMLCAGAVERARRRRNAAADAAEAAKLRAAG